VENIQSLHWQLAVLSKAIHYKNLSGAASHVGLSQPQLSRIVQRLEAELGIVLLDRTARRKSGWTPIAFKVAETYFQTSRKLTQQLQQLTTEDHITSLTIGTLEGLVPMANEFCRQLFDQAKIQLVELDVYDLSELESRFEKDELDLMFTFREPGKHKYRFVRQLGYQVVEKSGAGDGPRVFSGFDYANHLHRAGSKKQAQKDDHVLVSNSLAVRRHWIDELGGQGILPSDVKRRKTSESDVPVILMASDMFNTSLWQKFEQFRL
jgi:DNA-binding transcriptional LysR family regulator